MDISFKMGKTDGLFRKASSRFGPTAISTELHSRLLTAAIAEARRVLATFFALPEPAETSETWAADYLEVYREALDMGLIQPGGVLDKDHLSIWCLGRYLHPQTYVESGVFQGSSLHAMIRSSEIPEVYAIDPDLSRLKLERSELPEKCWIDQLDFSEFNFLPHKGSSLIYFDDHINAADRIIQSTGKGYAYLLIDDATGMEGMCQRAYPAVPSLPMILQPGLFSPGDRISWSFQYSPSRDPVIRLKQSIKSILHGRAMRLEWVVTEKWIKSCRLAMDCIQKWIKLPNLGDYIPQRIPGKTSDQTKFLLQLRHREDT